MSRRTLIVFFRGWGAATIVYAMLALVIFIAGEDRPVPANEAPSQASLPAAPRLPAFPGSLANSPEFLHSLEGSAAAPREFLAAARSVPDAAAPTAILPPELMPPVIPAGPASPATPVIPAVASELDAPIIPAAPVIPAASSLPTASSFQTAPVIPAAAPVYRAASQVAGAPTAPVVPVPTMTSQPNAMMPISPATYNPASAGPVAPPIVVPVASAPMTPPPPAAKPVPPPVRAPASLGAVVNSPLFRSTPGQN